MLTGFKAGIGLVIVLDQVPKLLGLHIAKEGFFRDILSVVHHLPETSLLTLAIAIAAIVALLAMERLWLARVSLRVVLRQRQRLLALTERVGHLVQLDMGVRQVCQRDDLKPDIAKLLRLVQRGV